MQSWYDNLFNKIILEGDLREFQVDTGCICFQAPGSDQSECQVTVTKFDSWVNYGIYQIYVIVGPHLLCSLHEECKPMQSQLSVTDFLCWGLPSYHLWYCHLGISR